MALKLTCPTCTATFGLPDDQRGKKAFCPKCGQALVVTGAGVAKRGEGHGVDRPTARGFPWLLLLLALLLLLPGALVVYLVTRSHPESKKQVVAKKDDEPKRNSDNGRDHVPVDPEPAPKPKDTPKEKDPPKKEPSKKPDPEVIPPVEVIEQPPLGVRHVAAIALPKSGVKLERLDYNVTLSPDGKTLAVGGWQYGVIVKQISAAVKSDQYIWKKTSDELWDVAGRKKTKTLAGFSGAVFAQAFSPDNKTLVSAGSTLVPGSSDFLNAQGIAVAWDVATGESINTFNTPKAVYSLAFSADGNTVAAVAGFITQEIRLWDLRTGKNTALTSGASYPYYSVAFSPVGTTLAVLNYDEKLKKSKFQWWDAATGKTMGELPIPFGSRYSCAGFSLDGKNVATATMDADNKKLFLDRWQLPSGKNIKSFTLDPATPVAFSWDGKTLATYDGTIKSYTLWDVGSGKNIAELGHTDFVRSISFSHDMKTAATLTCNYTSGLTALSGISSADPTWTIHLWELSGWNSSPASDK